MLVLSFLCHSEGSTQVWNCILFPCILHLSCEKGALGVGRILDAVHTWLSRVMPSQESVSPSGDELPRQAVLGFLPPLTPC